jgi:hypothetical protein
MVVWSYIELRSYTIFFPGEHSRETFLLLLFFPLLNVKPL